MKKNRTSLVMFLSILLILLVSNFVMVAPYLLAVLMGGLLALICKPFYLWLCRKGLGPKVASLVMTMAVIILIVGPLTGLVIAAIDQAVEVQKAISQNQSLTFDAVADWASRWKPLRTVFGDAAAVQKQLQTSVQKLASAAPAAVLGIFGSLPEMGLQLALAMISCYFFMTDGAAFKQWLKERIPLDMDVREKLFRAFNETAISSIVATVFAALVQSAIMMAAFIILGVPGAILAAGATFIFAWIPILGSTPVWLVGSIYLYVHGDIGRTVAMIAFGLVTSVSDNIARPMVLKGRGEMHPLVSLVAIFGGIAMFGLFGVFIGPILAGLLLSVLQIWPAMERRFALLEPSVESANIAALHDGKSSTLLA